MRAPFHGFVHEGLTSLALLVAIRYFEGGDTAKSFIASAASMGLLFSPIVLGWVARTGRKVAASASMLLAGSACAMGCAVFADSLWVFCLCVGIAAMLSIQLAPLTLQIYTYNYPENERGKRLSYTSIVAGLGAALATYGVGTLLDNDMGLFRWAFALVVGAIVFNGVFISRMPSDSLTLANVGNPWKNMKLVLEDKVFGMMIAAWMLMGIANLMTIPLRTEYMANPDFGVNASNSQITFVIVAVPAITRMLVAPIWGFLFDRLPLIGVRTSINVFVLASILIFFNSTSVFWLGVAMCFAGIATSGGGIAWSLWVTKLAPPDKVPAYMSVHTVTTGLRGTLSPFLGFYLLGVLTAPQIALLGTGLTVVSTFMFVGMIKHPRFKRSG